MSAKSNFLEDKIINHVLRNTAYTSPTTVYVSLYTSNPNEDNSGSEVSTSGTGYARQAGTFGAPSNGATDNTADITFGPASSNWGTITHFGVHDASTAGNLLYYGALSASKAVDTGDSLKFSTGALDIAEL